MKQLERLPAGRYVLVPEEEIGEKLTPEDEAALAEVLADFERGAARVASARPRGSTAG